MWDVKEEAARQVYDHFQSDKGKGKCAIKDEFGCDKGFTSERIFKIAKRRKWSPARPLKKHRFVEVIGAAVMGFCHSVPPSPAAFCGDDLTRPLFP